MMSHVLGVREPAALTNAAHLGMAMQLTNICRDVGEDWGRGRLYLPSSLLAAAGMRLPRDRQEPLPESARVPLASVTRTLLERAECFYESGDRGIPALPFRAAMTVRAARLVYSDIGRVILRRGADPFAPRAVVGKVRKLLLSLRAVVETLPMAGRGFVPAKFAAPLGCSDVVRI
ncbi:MAG TPA: squalene/phytoene synthase family protein [Polyangiaceae bacterium]|jgi:phytoene synthase|nr:squalene/phytoene synthase family protein [Polyangiaceae bacterium]